MVLRAKPEAKENKWLHFTPRIAALGIDAFDRGPPMIPKIHADLVRELNSAENEGEKSTEYRDRTYQTTLETIWTGNMRGEEGFERTDSMLGRLGGGWPTPFLTKTYPGLSRCLIRELLKAITGLSIVVVLGLFVTFEAENFSNRPAMLLTEEIQSLRLNGLLTLTAIAHGKLGELIAVTRYPEQMRESLESLHMKNSTASWTKMRHLRHTMIRFLLQQNRFGTGEYKRKEKKEDLRRYVGGMPLLTDLCLAMRTEPLALIRGVSELVTVIYGPALTFAVPDRKV